MQDELQHTSQRFSGAYTYVEPVVIADEKMPPPDRSPLEEAPPSVEESLSEPQIELDELQRAALDIPDSEKEDGDGQGDSGAEAAGALALTAGSANGIAAAVGPAAGVALIRKGLTGPSHGSAVNGEWKVQDWLRVPNQSLSLASAATSAGFSVAKGVTGFSLFLAKRFTQLAVALPAMLVDSANGAIPGSKQATFSALAHSSVGGLFDLFRTLALGGIDLGSSLTSAGLGVASSGAEGVRRALGSEVIKSLGQFVKLVQREWNAENDCLPPGGIPPFGLIGVTRAIVVWICIQMVTRESYERKMLHELQEVDLVSLRRQIEEKQDEGRSDGAGARLSTVRITSSELTSDRGEVIGAEVSSAGRSAAIAQDDTSTESAAVTEPLSDKEALQGLLRYSSLVLAVYGGTALAWFGALPKEDAEAARVARNQGGATAADPASRNQLSGNAPLPTDGLTREQDEEQFLMAAAMMDLTETEREEQEKRFTSRRSVRPSVDVATGNVIFSADETENTALDSRAALGTPAEPSGVARPATTTLNTEAAPSDRTGSHAASTYSYLDLFFGRCDEELFHRIGKVDPEHVRVGSYAPHEGAPPDPPRDRSAVARPSQPRYYIVTDHKAQKVVLILRGSLTIGDIAADLTCESREFHFPDPESRVRRQSPTSQGTSAVPFPASEASTSRNSLNQCEKYREEKYRQYVSQIADNDDDEADDTKPLVHEGIYETALALGSPYAPVHRAVRLALEASPSYSLDIAGHSLGAGVASILAILWANPSDCLTTQASGLPSGRRVHAYCYACPATMSKELGSRCEALITTLVYSYDLVCRLSLGSILDIRNAAAWILWEDRQQQARATRSDATGSSSASGAFDPSNRSTPLRVTSLIRRAFEHQSGRFDPVVDKEGNNDSRNIKTQTEQDFLALRTTLEANMRNVELYPPGQVLYLLAAGELLQSHFEQSVNGQDATAAPSLRTGSTTLTKRQHAFVLRRRPRGTPTMAAAAPSVTGHVTIGKRENVFGQIVFSRRLLSSHMPQHYDLALRGLE